MASMNRMEKRFNINLQLKIPKTVSSNEELVQYLTKDIRNTEVGYAGFSERKYLTNTLGWQIVDPDQKVEKYEGELVFDSQEILSELENCAKTLPTQSLTHVYIFPTFSSFVKEQMNGVSGFTPYKHTILLFLHVDGFSKKALAQAIAHEYAHSVSYSHFELKTVVDGLIFEGIAEHFAEHITQSNSPLSKHFNAEESFKWLKKIEPILDSETLEDHRELFVYGNTYPQWLGYSIGYQIIKVYRENNPGKTFPELVQTKPQLIFNRSTAT